jgi:hypothetical protein
MCRLFHSKSLFCAVVTSVFIALLTFYTGPTVIEAQGQRGLLGRRIDNINATSNVTQDVTLPGGFVLSGAARGADGLPVFFGTIIAQNATQATQTFTGTITFMGFSSTYRVVLPAGTYRLFVQRANLEGGDESLTLITSEVGMVTVAANRTLDIIVPAGPPTFAVSGNVTSMGTLPTKGTITFTSLDGRTRATGSFDRNYRVSLPAGTYNVEIGPELTQPSDVMQFLSLRRGMVTVNGPQTFNIMLPATVTLSGNLRQANGSLAVPSTVFAIDTADIPNQPVDVGDCEGNPFATFPATFGTAFVPQESTTGAYRFPLPLGSYGVSAGLDLDPSNDVSSTLSFPVPLRQVTLMADRTENVTFPPVPPFVTISGRVTDMNGQPVARASVSATTSMITNTPNAAFSTAVLTGGDGRYTARVLSGINYTLLVCPPETATANSAANKSCNKINRLLRPYLVEQ